MAATSMFTQALAFTRAAADSRAMRAPSPPPPIDAPALLAHAAALLQAGRPADALPSLAEAARLRPGDAAILHDLGLASLACGHIEQAIAALRAAIAAKPRFAGAHLRLAIALERQGSAQEALAAYRRAWEIEPALADARYRAGELLDNLGRTAEAARVFARAAATAPATTLGRMAAARARMAERRDAEAETILRALLAQEPAQAAALELLGQVLSESGRFTEARDVLLRAIAAAPERAGAYYDVARCQRIGPGEADLLAAMRAALDLPGLDAIARARVHLALGKAADDLDTPGEAMAHFDAAQALRDGAVRFDLAAFEARVDRMIARVTPDFLAEAVPLGAQDATPIVIIGLPRSGTTLMEQILSAHPQVGAAGELPFWNVAGPQWERAPGPRACRRAAGDYLRTLRDAAPGAARVTDKMPLNFLWAGLIHAALPRATIIHCRRSPIDTALSIHQTHFSARMAFPTGGAALVAAVRAYLRLCAHWRAVLPAGRFVDIEYEQLVTAPEDVIRFAVQACGLAWDEACLHPERNAAPVRTASKWQARQPIYRDAMGRAQRYAPYLGELEELGGECLSPQTPRHL